MVPRREYRAVLEAADSLRYFVHSFGLVLQRNGKWLASVNLDEGLAPIYSAVEWRRPDGQRELVVGASSGVYRLVERARFERVAIPGQMPQLDAMVAADQGGAAAPPLLPSSKGRRGVGRPPSRLSR